jgi:hypothetical protein
LIAAVQQTQRLHRRRLRLDRDHPRAEAAKRTDPVAHMRADIEHQIAGPHELTIKRLHAGPPLRTPVVDAQRAQYAGDAA